MATERNTKEAASRPIVICLLKRSYKENISKQSETRDTQYNKNRVTSDLSSETMQIR